LGESTAHITLCGLSQTRFGCQVEAWQHPCSFQLFTLSMVQGHVTLSADPEQRWSCDRPIQMTVAA
jgi:hypothetical protein